MPLSLERMLIMDTHILMEYLLISWPLEQKEIQLPLIAEINKLFTRNEVTVLNGTAEKACVTNGVSAIEGGTGIADMTLAASV